LGDHVDLAGAWIVSIWHRLADGTEYYFVHSFSFVGLEGLWRPAAWMNMFFFSQINYKLDQLLTQQARILSLLTKQGATNMGVKEDVAALVAETERQKTVAASVVSLLNNLTAMMAAAASNTTDPVTAKALNDAVAALKANDDTIADAVTANTPQE
jgi:hypothetical protein